MKHTQRQDYPILEKLTKRFMHLSELNITKQKLEWHIKENYWVVSDKLWSSKTGFYDQPIRYMLYKKKPLKVRFYSDVTYKWETLDEEWKWNDKKFYYY
jgi:hypothetical protein